MVLHGQEGKGYPVHRTSNIELSDLQRAVLKLLAEHPHVYTVSLPRLPLEIRMQEARIQIDKRGEGASLSEQERAMYEMLREKAIEQISGNDHPGGTRL